MIFTALDLFCGAVGGWSQGLHAAGIATLAACEIDEWRRNVFSAQFPSVAMYEDVRQLTATRLVRDIGNLPNVIVGSPPCQDISAANTRGRGIDGECSGLFWEALRLVNEVRPLWACLENSPRIRTLGYDALADELEAIGYATWPLVVEARHAGANHRRGRAWIIAADADRSELWKLPGWRGGADRAGAAVAGGDAEYAAGERCLQGRSALQGGALSVARAGGTGGSAHDPHPHGRIAHGARRHADGCQRMGAGADEQAPADAEQDGHEGRREDRDGGQADAALPPALADIGRAWPHWNGGLAGLAASCAAAGVGAVDDGAEPLMVPGLRNRAIAALGDAIIPQIAEAIARSMMGLFR